MLVQPESFSQQTTGATANNRITDFPTRYHPYPALPTRRTFGDVENQTTGHETLAFGAGSREVAGAFDATRTR
jgi:hypothetical protein